MLVAIPGQIFLIADCIENIARFHLEFMQTELWTLSNQSISPDDFHCVLVDTNLSFFSLGPSTNSFCRLWLNDFFK